MLPATSTKEILVKNDPLLIHCFTYLLLFFIFFLFFNFLSTTEDFL